MEAYTHLYHTTLLIRAKEFFFGRMIHTLKPFFTGTVIQGGDLNIPFNLTLDKSNLTVQKPRRPPKQSLKIAHLMHKNGLLDIWREINPRVKDYTRYSAPHSTHARIDHIFLQCSIIPLVLSAKI